jgi:hypothetical protein
VDWTPVEQAWVADTDGDAALAAIASKATALIQKASNDNGGSAARTKENLMSDQLKALAASLGLPEDATDEQITEKTTALAARAAELETENEQLKATASAAEHLDPAAYEELKAQAAQGAEALAHLARARQEQKVDAAIEGGTFPPSQRDHYLALMSQNEEGTTEFIDSLATGVIPVGERGVSPDTETTNGDGGRVPLDTVLASFGSKRRAVATGKEQ